MSRQIHIELGRLPAPWERDGIFFANLLSLFFGNEEETQVLKTEVRYLGSYGGRLMPILDLIFQPGGNLLVLEEPPDAALCRYFEKDLGLSLPDFEVLSHENYRQMVEALADEQSLPLESMRHISNHPAAWVDGFVTDDSIASLAQALGKSTITSIPGSRKGNDKIALHRFLESSGLPVFSTFFVSSIEEAKSAWKDLQTQGFEKAAIKSAVGASGVGLVVIREDQDVDSLPDYLFNTGECMLQGWIEVGKSGVKDISSPSVQIFVKHKDVTIYDMTDQILSEQSIHQGNISPPKSLQGHPVLQSTLLDQARRVSSWLHAQDYRGLASIDFLVAHRDLHEEVYVCEINARVTGASYPALLARHVSDSPAWVMRNLHFTSSENGRDILQQMEKETLLYSAENPEGVLPINFNLNTVRQVDKGQFLTVGETVEACWSQMATLCKTLPLNWEDARD